MKHTVNNTDNSTSQNTELMVGDLRGVNWAVSPGLSATKIIYNKK